MGRAPCSASWKWHIKFNGESGGLPIVSGGVMSTVTITQEGLEHITVCMWIMRDCMIAVVSGGLDYKLE